ncbi:Cytochrome P450 [Mycena indigotica]|uniref:Cytochrome P450 n=1 Tax=Mycena indigotica TaxID=2126181 RepID=A0A8H6SH65_9AGAR|nr:Cytochrome P450 [Mycena indigotica]KAF7298616.1 Cytochrome P450 [Mycena indigotica]
MWAGSNATEFVPSNGVLKPRGCDYIWIGSPPRFLLMFLDVPSLLLLVSAGALAVVFRRRQRGLLPLPPGPRKLFLLGNLLHMPSSFEWETFGRFSQESNSDIIHLDVAGMSVVVLSSLEANIDLLEKRSTIYSDRPRAPMLNELMGWDFNFAFMKYDFNSDGVTKYRSHQRAACHGLLRRLLDDPGQPLEHIRHMAREIILSTVYGIQVLPKDDPYVETAEAALNSLVHGHSPIRFLVNMFPTLLHVPYWMPGASFKRIAREWRKLSTKFVNLPFDETRRQMVCRPVIVLALAGEHLTITKLNGDARPSFTASHLISAPASEHETIKNAAATAFSAGTHTTVALVGKFLMAMLSNPDAQRKAQAEIDAVCGGRLPTFELLEDAESTIMMPYVSAVMRELFRWEPTVPLVQHFIEVEDEYRGLRIPAQSVVIGNIWWVSVLFSPSILMVSKGNSSRRGIFPVFHLCLLTLPQEKYPNPTSFRPERWLLPSGALNPDMHSGSWEFGFGFGRRVCAGQRLGLASLWISITSILASLDVQRAVDENGVVIEPEFEFISGLIRQPVPFACSIKPRSAEAEMAIRETEFT